MRAFIPFARVADMLLHPGEPFDFDGRRLVYPEIRLVYGCGGNPFHHHRLWPSEVIVLHDPAASGPFPVRDEHAAEGVAGLIRPFDRRRPGQRGAGDEGNNSVHIRPRSEQRQPLRHRHRRLPHEDALVGALATRTPVAAGSGAVTVSDARRTSEPIMMSS